MVDPELRAATVQVFRSTAAFADAACMDIVNHQESCDPEDADFWEVTYHRMKSIADALRETADEIEREDYG